MCPFDFQRSKVQAAKMHVTNVGCTYSTNFFYINANIMFLKIAPRMGTPPLGIIYMLVDVMKWIPYPIQRQKTWHYPKKHFCVIVFFKWINSKEKPKMVFAIKCDLLVVKFHSNTSLTIGNIFCIHFIQIFVLDLYIFLMVMMSFVLWY